MTFIRRKIIKGNAYLYEVESYRDPVTGKGKQRVLAYLGREQKLGITNDTTTFPTTFRHINVAIGTTVHFTDHFGFKNVGIVISPELLVRACDIARRREIQVLAPCIKPGFVMVEYESAFLGRRVSQFVAVSEIVYA